MQHLNGDEIQSNVGSNSKNIVTGKDIDQDVREASATGNVTNIYGYGQPPNDGEPPRPGELVADAANELWKAIAELNKIMGGLNISVADNTRATREQAQSIDTLARTTEHQSAAIDNLAKKTDQLGQTTLTQGERSEAQFRDFRAQITTLQRVALALRPLGIQVPDMPEGHLPPVPVRQSPWWQPYATPLLLSLILIVLILGLGVFGGGP